MAPKRIFDAIPLALPRRVIAEGQLDQGNLIIALLTGDEESANAIGGKYERAYGLAAEVLAYAAEEVKNLPEPDQGVIMGALAFEVVTTLLPGGQLKHATKAKMLDDLAVGRFAASSPGGAVFAKVMLLLDRLRTTKMCFVAGTMVMSAQGAVPIEAVRPGMEVWARDEFTLAEGWRPVLQTFTTHPEELFTLGYDTDGDGAPDEELTGTGEHPFWVEDFGDFLPMRDLRPGMRLSLAQEGGTAIVTGNVSKRGPPGEWFTTYNFEVAEYHTYFVGGAGVWVHNSGDAPCQLARAAMETLRSQNGDGWLSMRQALSRFSRSDLSPRTRLKLFNETRTEVLAGRWPAGSAPWDDLTNQTRGLGLSGSTSFQNQIAGYAGNSKDLGENLLAIGIEAPWKRSGSETLAAHHIVAGGEKYESAVEARRILANAGIDINEAANGVFLPRSAADSDLGMANHPGRHTENYSRAVLARLEPHAGNASALRRELQAIADHSVNVGWIE